MYTWEGVWASPAQAEGYDGSQLETGEARSKLAMWNLMEGSAKPNVFSVSKWPLRLIAHKFCLRRQNLNSDLHVYVSRWSLRLISHKSCLRRQAPNSDLHLMFF